MGFFSETLRRCEAGTVTTILSKHLTCIHHDMFMSKKTHVLQKINLSLSCYLPEDFHKLWPKRLRAESTHPENWPKRPTYQGRNDPSPKLAETTQAETTQGRNDPDSSRTQHGDACGDRTQDLSIRSPTLYHYATAHPKDQKLIDSEDR